MGVREGRRGQWGCEGHTGVPWRTNSWLMGSEGKPNPRETCVNIVGQSLDHRATLAPMSVTHRPQHRFLTAGFQAEAQAPLAYIPTPAPSRERPAAPGGPTVPAVGAGQTPGQGPLPTRHCQRIVCWTVGSSGGGEAGGRQGVRDSAL